MTRTMKLSMPDSNNVRRGTFNGKSVEIVGKWFGYTTGRDYQKSPTDYEVRVNGSVVNHWYGRTYKTLAAARKAAEKACQ